MTQAALTIYAIAPGVAMADALAQGLWDRHGRQDALGLAKVRLYLPTRRAMRSVREAFLRLSEGRPLLLPDMRAIGETNEDETFFDALAMGDGDAPLPPAIHPLRRVFLLAELIAARPDAPQTAAGRFKLAQELAALLDSLQIEEKTFDGFDKLAPENLAQHWQTTLRFLDILKVHWPAIRASESAMDPMERRALLTRREAASLAHHDGPVYIAGSTGSAPATAALIAAVAAHAQGAAILPGWPLDADLDDIAAIAQDPSHALYGLAQLLARLHQPSLQPWPYGAMDEARASCLNRAMLPAARTALWAAQTPPPAAALDGLEWMVARDAQEEATALALAIRDALETPAARVMLVTPDRDLARRVVAEAERFGLRLDDSGGQPLGQTPAGRFFRLVAEAAEDQFSPVRFLALMKHPFAHMGEGRGEHLARLRRIEKRILRGPRPGQGLAGLRDALIAAEDSDAVAWLQRLMSAVKPMAEMLQQPAVAMPDILAAHIALAEALSRPASDAPARLWQGEDGAALAQRLGEWHAAAQGLRPVRADDWPLLVAQILAGVGVRPRAPSHPRVAILGPLEARMQSADLVILAGLNEGVWPPPAETGPWLSRPMRASLNLPQPERAIGLAAHDFLMLAASPRVLLSRADKRDGSPALPARWWLRLETLMGQEAWSMREARSWIAWARAWDKPEARHILPPPAPRPPAAARPKELSVTRLETLVRDPYAIYALTVLRLKPLDPIDQSPDHLDIGNAVHAAMEAFIKAYPDHLPPDIEGVLIAEGRKALAHLLQDPMMRAFVWPKFLRMAKNMALVEREHRHKWKPLAVETQGRIEISTTQGAVTLTAKADRIDISRDGRALMILDYKTGSAPSAKQVLTGFAPQLPIEAAMAQKGGCFEGVQALPVEGLTYWQVMKRDADDIANPIGYKARDVNHFTSMADMIETQFAHFTQLIGRYAQEDQPYLSQPRPQFVKHEGDYDHLARVAEWRDQGGEAE